MFIARRALARKLVALAGGLSLSALAAQASAATMYSTIWVYYNAQKQPVGTAGLACDGGVFEYDGDLPEGGYARHTTRRCDEGSWGATYCYAISGASGSEKLTSIPCYELPGFGY